MVSSNRIEKCQDELQEDQLAGQWRWAMERVRYISLEGYAHTP